MIESLDEDVEIPVKPQPERICAVRKLSRRRQPQELVEGQVGLGDLRGRPLDDGAAPYVQLAQHYIASFSA